MSVFVREADVKLSHLKIPDRTKVAERIVDHLEDYWRAYLEGGSERTQSKDGEEQVIFESFMRTGITYEEVRDAIKGYTFDGKFWNKHDDYVNQLTPGVDAIINAFNETKEKAMNDNQPYVMKEYVNGRNIDDMTADEMIDAISIHEEQLNHLSNIYAKAKGIEDKKDQIDSAINRLAERLDK
jgi:hypothetical protein